MEKGQLPMTTDVVEIRPGMRVWFYRGENFKESIIDVKCIVVGEDYWGDGECSWEYGEVCYADKRNAILARRVTIMLLELECPETSNKKGGFDV